MKKLLSLLIVAIFTINVFTVTVSAATSNMNVQVIHKYKNTANKVITETNEIKIDLINPNNYDYFTQKEYKGKTYRIDSFTVERIPKSVTPTTTLPTDPSVTAPSTTDPTTTLPTDPSTIFPTAPPVVSPTTDPSTTLPTEPSTTAPPRIDRLFVAKGVNLAASTPLEPVTPVGTYGADKIVYMNDDPGTKKNYTIAPGSQLVFSEDYTYTVTINYSATAGTGTDTQPSNNDQPPATSNSAQATTGNPTQATNNNSAQTGDESNVILFVGLAVLAALMATGSAIPAVRKRYFK